MSAGVCEEWTPQSQAQMSAGVCEEWTPLEHKQQNHGMKPQVRQLL